MINKIKIFILLFCMIFICYSFEFDNSGVKESLKWQNKQDPYPILKKDGVVRFPYGQYQPVIICKINNLCDIELQVGEQIQGILIGDSQRWNDGDQGIPVVYSGTANELIAHLVLKPSEVNLETTLMITTSKRTYMIKLRSSNHDYIARSGFYYPNENTVDYSVSLNVLKEHSSLQSNLINNFETELAKLKPLNYQYKIIGDVPSIAPEKVFDDDISVYIKMSNKIDSTNLPSICILINKEDKCELVNFRYINHYFIIDKLFNEAKLIDVLDKNKFILISKKTPNQTQIIQHKKWNNLFGN